MNDSSNFPVAPRPFDGGSRTVEAGACFDWLRQGWALFAANPGTWIATAVLFLVLYFALAVVPLIGQLACNLLVPVLAAGLMHMCARQSEGEDPQIGDLFIGFRRQTGNLIVVGLLYMAGVVGITVLVMLLVGGGVAGGVVAGHLFGAGLVFGSLLLGGFLILILSVPLIMAVWFAPALVFFNGMKPVEAMKASFAACLRNWLAFLVYGLVLFVLMFFAALPLGLGFLILIPVMSGALYASYRDVFVVV